MQTVLDLFAGIGGFSLGASQAGLKVLAAYEIDRAACDMYEKIGPHVVQADLGKVDPSTLPDADGIIGGPPCQAFSTAGLRDWKNDPRNMFPATLEIIRAKRPEWVLLENVRGLISSTVYDAVVTALKGMGYRVSVKLLNAADFGLPQTRERVFVAAYRGGRWNWPDPTHSEQRGLFTEKWIGWGTYATHLNKRRNLPNWLASRLPTVPDNALFSRQLSQFQRPTPLWRYSDRPAFTITSNDGASAPIMWQGEAYRATPSFNAALQGLPYMPGLTDKQIGNAVPPPLAAAILAAHFGGGTYANG